MNGLRENLVYIVHYDLDKYTSVIFSGSGTINTEVCINSLLLECKIDMTKLIERFWGRSLIEF